MRNASIRSQAFAYVVAEFYQARRDMSQPVFTEEAVDCSPSPVRWICYVKVPGHDNVFPRPKERNAEGSHDTISFAQKKGAKQFAAKCS
jgi:hypothetical protein